MKYLRAGQKISGSASFLLRVKCMLRPGQDPSLQEILRKYTKKKRFLLNLIIRNIQWCQKSWRKICLTAYRNSDDANIPHKTIWPKLNQALIIEESCKKKIICCTLYLKSEADQVSQFSKTWNYSSRWKKVNLIYDFYVFEMFANSLIKTNIYERINIIKFNQPLNNKRSWAPFYLLFCLGNCIKYLLLKFYYSGVPDGVCNVGLKIYLIISPIK